MCWYLIILLLTWLLCIKLESILVLYICSLSVWSAVLLYRATSPIHLAFTSPGTSGLVYSSSYSMRRDLRSVFILSRAWWGRIGGTSYGLLSQFGVPLNHHWQPNNGSHLSSLNSPSWAGCGCISGNGYWLTSSQGSLWPSCTSLRVRIIIIVLLIISKKINYVNAAHPGIF